MCGSAARRRGAKDVGTGQWMKASVGVSGDVEKVSSGKPCGHVLVVNPHDVVLVSGSLCRGCWRGDGCERV